VLAKKKQKKPQSFYSLAFLNLYVEARHPPCPSSAANGEIDEVQAVLTGTKQVFGYSTSREFAQEIMVEVRIEEIYGSD